MKLATFDTPAGERRCGVVRDGVVTILDLPDLRTLYERGDALVRAEAASGEELALADVTLRAPIEPKKFLHTAGNFREHEEESKQVDWSHRIAP
jgi:hypothetical protein